MKTQSSPTILQPNKRMKNTQIKASRRRKETSFSLPGAIGTVFVLIMVAALYASSSVSASRGVSRVSLPTAAPVIAKDKKGSTSRLKGHLSSFSPGSSFLSVLMPPPQPVPPPSDESVATYAVVSNLCTGTLKSTFALGEKVCVKVENAPLRAAAQLRRINFNDTKGSVRDTQEVTTDPQGTVFPLPNDNTSTVDGEIVDNRGTWSASSNSPSHGGTRA